MNEPDKVHVTADVPADLFERVEELRKKLDFSRSFAIRKGLALFLQTYRQELTETVSKPDDVGHESEMEVAHAR